jgi:alginate export protein
MSATTHIGAGAQYLALFIMLSAWSTFSFAQSSTWPDTAIPTTQPGPQAVNPSESILSEYTPEAPPNPTAPPYTLLRFNEDYHYLANPQNRTDLLDPLKYIPLNPDDSYSYLSLGGEVRERYEHYTNFGFGTFGQPDHDDYLLQRITLDADLHVNANVRFFLQGISGLQFGGEGSPPPVDQDGPDLQQAFADLKLDSSPDSPDYLIIRGGRFEMSYGSGRLVATRDGPNIPFKFDGLQLIGAENGGKIYAFITKPAQEQKNAFDDEFPGQLFWGVYGTTPMLAPGLGLKADLYYLGYRNNQAQYANGSGDEVRQTFGTRLFGAAGGFDYNIEPVVQTGRFDDHDILAWTFASAVGYRFERVPARPRLGLDFDVASGDTKRGAFGTFNAPYFNAGYFNDASTIRPSNIIDVHPTLELLPRDNVLLVLGSDVLWRYTNHDGIYAPPGNVEIPPGGSSRYAATTADLSVQWEIDRHLTWIASYSHFFTSDSVREQGGKDIDFFGTWLTFTW